MPFRHEPLQPLAAKSLLERRGRIGAGDRDRARIDQERQLRIVRDRAVVLEKMRADRDPQAGPRLALAPPCLASSLVSSIKQA